MLSYRDKQYIKLILLFITVISGIALFDICFQPPDVVIGGLVGALPLVMFESLDYFRNPHVTVSEPIVKKYPKTCYLVDSELKIPNMNAIVVRIPIENDGFGSIEDCSVRVGFEGISGSFSTRWDYADYPNSLIIPSGTTQIVDLFWMRLNDNDILVPTFERSSSDHYAKQTLHELRSGKYKIEIYVSGSNLSEKTFNIEFDGESVDLPKDLIRLSEDSDIITSTRKEQRYAIEFIKSNQQILELPEEMDLTELKVFSEFQQEDQSRPFEVWGPEKYDIRRRERKD